MQAYPDQPGCYYALHEPVQKLLRDQSSVEWTLICNGWLADYILPSKNRYIKTIDEFYPSNWANNTIVIPGTGNELVTFTWARDVARALVALVEAPKCSWEPYTFVSGENSCWNAIAKLIKQRYGPDIPIEYRSVHAIIEMIKNVKDEGTSILADYYLFTISQAAALPPGKVHAQRGKYFGRWSCSVRRKS